jgi:hypothetical protein
VGRAGGKHEGVGALFVFPEYAAWEVGSEELSYGFGDFDCELEGGVPIRVAADTLILMAGVYEEFLYLSSASVFPCVVNMASRTAISSKPNCAARWSEVLPLSVKSGFWRLLGLFLMMRLRRLRSLRWTARRMRVGTSILWGVSRLSRLSRLRWRRYGLWTYISVTVPEL